MERALERTRMERPDTTCPIFPPVAELTASALVERRAHRAPVLFSSRSNQPISWESMLANISRLILSTSRAPDREKVKPVTVLEMRKPAPRPPK